MEKNRGEFRRLTLTFTDTERETLQDLAYSQETTFAQAIRRANKRDQMLLNAVRRNEAIIFRAPDGREREMIITDFEHLRPHPQEE